MTDIDERRDQYFPCDANIAFKRTGRSLLEKFGPEGLCAWVLLLAAAKRELVQGTFVFSSEAEAWTKIGITPSGFTLDELLRRLGHLKQTRRTRHGHLTYVQLTRWEDWNKVYRRRVDGQRKAWKRHESRADTSRMVNGYPQDSLRTRARGSESESEITPYPLASQKSNCPKCGIAVRPPTTVADHLYATHGIEEAS